MKKAENIWKIKFVSLITVFLLTAGMSGSLLRLTGFISTASLAAAVPDGILGYFFSPNGNSNSPDIAIPIKQENSNISASSGESSKLSETRPTDVETGDILTTNLSAETANTTLENLHISNKSGLYPDFSSLLDEGLPFSLEATNQPQVLIYHTHATESYTQADYGYYITGENTRTTDASKNTIRVGQEIADVLNANGIVTINDDTQHDAESYTGSYSRSADTVRAYLEKYPTIKVIIDGHRDAITRENGTKVKPTAEINGKNAAQIMLLAGCETGDVTDYPNWQENLKINLLLQKQLETDYPGLCRPLSFKPCKYNFNIMNGAMLFEIGSEANTLEEAIYSGELIGNALVKVLSEN